MSEPFVDSSLTPLYGYIKLYGITMLLLIILIRTSSL